jgi:DNA polymerase sigma
MNKLEKIILEEFKKKVIRQFPDAELILYGSRARGDSSPESDMDILVILNDSPQDADCEYISHCAWETGYKEGIVIVPITVSRQEWENGAFSSSLLAMAVMEEGIKI